MGVEWLKDICVRKKERKAGLVHPRLVTIVLNWFGKL